MQRTITTINCVVLTAEKDENGEFTSKLTNVKTIAKDKEEAKKEFLKMDIAGVIVDYSEPFTALYQMNDYYFLNNSLLKPFETVVENDETPVTES